MKETIIGIVTSEVFLGYVAIAVILGLAYLMKKKPEWEVYKGLVYKAANMTEKALPDDLQNARLNKLDFFLKKFCAEYEKQFGIAPSVEVQNTAQAKVEEIIWNKNALREVNK